MERYYNIVGTDICIKGKDTELRINNQRLELFGIEKTSSSYTYEFSIVDTFEKCKGVCIFKAPSRRVFQDGKKKIHYIGLLDDSVESAYIRCEYDENEVRVQVKREKIQDYITSKIVLNSMGIGALALKNNAFILHASVVNVNGKAILFTAPSGTGKSTQAELWKEYRGANIINGDRAAVKVEENEVFAYGIPFAGSSEYCENVKLPIAGIVCLEQSVETRVSMIKGAQAFQRIWGEITIPLWEERATERISEILINTLANVPVYYLACSPDESAVIALENIMNGKR